MPTITRDAVTCTGVEWMLTWLRKYIPRPEMIIRAWFVADPSNASVRSARPCSITPATHRSLASKNATIASRISGARVSYSAASIPHRHMRWRRSASA